MFNDFKNLSYDSTKGKLRKIKALLDRLTLENYELELLTQTVEHKIDRLDDQIRDFPETYQEKKEEEKVEKDDGNLPGGGGTGGELPAVPPEEPVIPPIVITDVGPSGDSNSYFKVHVHNPEGYEINSITGIIETYRVIAIVNISGHTPINGASNLSEHGVFHTITPGLHSISTTFNDMTIVGSFTVTSGRLYAITVTFPRTSMDLSAVSYNHAETIHTLPPVGFDRPVSYSSFNKPFIIILGNNHDYYNINVEGNAQIELSLNLTNFRYYNITSFTGIYYQYSSLVYSDTTLDTDSIININPLPSINFGNWICQNLQKDFYPYLELTHNNIMYNPFDSNSIITTRTYSQPNPHYKLVLRPTTINYDGILTWYTSIGINNPKSSARASWIDPQEIILITGELLNGGLKISSVPYNLDGLAV
jgi:hypothetical protein